MIEGEKVGARRHEAWTLGNVGLLAHYRDDQAAAQGYAREALQMAQEIGDRAMQAIMWLQLGHALAGVKRLGEAAEAYRESLALRRALDLLEARAARISDEKMRRSFLGNVVAHRELIQAFARAPASVA